MMKKLEEQQRRAPSPSADRHAIDVKQLELRVSILEPFVFIYCCLSSFNL